MNTVMSAPRTHKSSLAEMLAASRAILFDMDGVLIDSEPVHEAAIDALAEWVSGRRLDPQVLLSFKGVPDREVAARMQALFPGASLTVPEWMSRAMELFVKQYHRVQPIDGARDFVIASKAAGLRVGLATSAARSSQLRAFKAFDFDGLFETIVTGEDVQRGKPDPEPYLLVASRLGVDPSACVVIEDSLNGVRSGKAAGCAVIGITTSFDQKALREMGADFVIGGYGELEQVSAAA